MLILVGAAVAATTGLIVQNTEIGSLQIGTVAGALMFGTGVQLAILSLGVEFAKFGDWA